MIVRSILQECVLITTQEYKKEYSVLNPIFNITRKSIRRGLCVVDESFTPKHSECNP
jgi:hypothetical protein